MHPLFLMVVAVLISSGMLFGPDAHATTSCSPSIHYIGYDSSAIYYEVSNGGDCIPFKALYHADLQSKETYELIKVSAESGEDWQSDYVRKKDHWLAVHQIQLTRPAPRQLPKSCKLGAPVVESAVEVGMHSRAKKIREAFHYKGESPFWVVVSAHCYEAAWSGYTEKTCPTIDHLSVYRAGSCMK